MASSSSLLLSKSEGESEGERESEMNSSVIVHVNEPNWFVPSVASISGLGVVIALLGFMLTLSNRNDPAFKLGQPLVTMFACFGLMNLNGAMLLNLITPEESATLTGSIDAKCVAELWWVHFSLTIILGSLSSKYFRLWRIFRNPSVSRTVKVSDDRIVGIVLLLLVVTLILLYVAMLLGPPTMENVELPSSSSSSQSSESGKFISTCVQPASSRGVIFALMAFHGMVLLLGLFCAFQNRKLGSILSEFALLNLSNIAGCGIVCISLIFAPITVSLSKKVLSFSVVVAWITITTCLALFSTKLQSSGETAQDIVVRASAGVRVGKRKQTGKRSRRTKSSLSTSSYSSSNSRALGNPIELDHQANSTKRVKGEKRGKSKRGSTAASSTLTVSSLFGDMEENLHKDEHLPGSHGYPEQTTIETLDDEEHDQFIFCKVPQIGDRRTNHKQKRHVTAMSSSKLSSANSNDACNDNDHSPESKRRRPRLYRHVPDALKRGNTEGPSVESSKQVNKSARTYVNKPSSSSTPASASASASAGNRESFSKAKETLSTAFANRQTSYQPQLAEPPDEAAEKEEQHQEQHQGEEEEEEEEEGTVTVTTSTTGRGSPPSIPGADDSKMQSINKPKPPPRKSQAPSPTKKPPPPPGPPPSRQQQLASSSDAATATATAQNSSSRKTRPRPPPRRPSYPPPDLKEKMNAANNTANAVSTEMSVDLEEKADEPPTVHLPNPPALVQTRPQRLFGAKRNTTKSSYQSSLPSAGSTTTAPASPSPPPDSSHRPNTRSQKAGQTTPPPPPPPPPPPLSTEEQDEQTPPPPPPPPPPPSRQDSLLSHCRIPNNESVQNKSPSISSAGGSFTKASRSSIADTSSSSSSSSGGGDNGSKSSKSLKRSSQVSQKSSKRDNALTMTLDPSDQLCSSTGMQSYTASPKQNNGYSSDARRNSSKKSKNGITTGGLNLGAKTATPRRKSDFRFDR